MRQRRLQLILAALVLAAHGCFLDHGRGADAGDASDGAPRDGSFSDARADGDAMCPRIAGYPGCGEVCGCTGPGCGGVCRPDGTCYPHVNVCVPLSENDTCLRNGDTGVQIRYCRGGAETCAMPPTSAAGGGACLRDEYCREAPEHDIDIVCRYSDDSVWVDGPPDEGACPSPPDADAPFCGGSCGDCPPHAPPTDPWFPTEDWTVSCMGRNEERGFGICTFGGMGPCARNQSAYAGLCEGTTFEGQPCACLVQRRADGEWPVEGVATFVTSCRAYRARYPGTVECYEPFSWTPYD